jgi:hypothetical protein
MTERQIVNLYWRPRDKNDRLIRQGHSYGDDSVEAPKTDQWKKCNSFMEMYRKVWADRGKSPEEVEDRWLAWLDKNPKLKMRIERNERAKRRRYGLE